LSTNSWPVFIAHESASYAKYGLSVNPVLGADPAWVPLLARGEAAMGIGGLQQLLPAATRDKSLVAVASIMNKSTLRLVARADIGGVEQLKGKKIAVSTVGDAPYGFLVALLKEYGIAPDQIQFLPVGTSGTRRAAAVVGGRADAALLSASVSFALEQSGYKIIAELADHENIFTSIASWVRRSDLSSSQGLLERLIQAHAEAIQRFYADKDFALRAYLDFDKQADATAQARAYDMMAAHNVFERVPYTLKGAVAAAQDMPPGLRPAVDNSIVDRLVRRGFFEDLFGPGIKSEQQKKAALAL